ncbi:benzoate/H(+) symporter BenE family transporter [Arcobacter cryaerophilus gv. pseudocryaerophilus]
MDRKVSNILPPIIAGLISVIVNYGGTFILIFQAAQIAGLNPEQTASWVWSISIGVGITGIISKLVHKRTNNNCLEYSSSCIFSNCYCNCFLL